MQAAADASSIAKVDKYLRNAVKREPSISSLAVMTADGFPLVFLMGKGEAEKTELAAAIASLGSLSEQTATRLGIGQYKDLMLRCTRGHLIIREIIAGTMLAAQADRSAQLGAVHMFLDRMVTDLAKLLQ
jgi:predicted regulator of Ras-like GTPase activity (Roadblock/LC7/MglB family)